MVSSCRWVGPQIATLPKACLRLTRSTLARGHPTGFATSFGAHARAGLCPPCPGSHPAKGPHLRQGCHCHGHDLAANLPTVRDPHCWNYLQLSSHLGPALPRPWACPLHLSQHWLHLLHLLGHPLAGCLPHLALGPPHPRPLVPRPGSRRRHARPWSSCCSLQIRSLQSESKCQPRSRGASLQKQPHLSACSHPTGKRSCLRFQ
mmetsp:Transcript_72036/g.166870  ORF Transcript_72036/g.166870 Transcript_72036/m.166870 type:complete len:204 (+) Transcript_72036:514-1125(+)